MRIIEFEGGYKGRLSRSSRTSGATWSWDLVDSKHDVVASGNGSRQGVLSNAGEAEAAVRAAYERITTPKVVEPEPSVQPTETAEEPAGKPIVH